MLISSYPWHASRHHRIYSSTAKVISTNEFQIEIIIQFRAARIRSRIGGAEVEFFNYLLRKAWDVSCHLLRIEIWNHRRIECQTGVSNNIIFRRRELIGANCIHIWNDFRSRMAFNAAGKLWTARRWFMNDIWWVAFIGICACTSNEWSHSRKVNVIRLPSKKMT